MLTISYTANLSHRQQASLPFPWIPQLCVPQLWQPPADYTVPIKSLKRLKNGNNNNKKISYFVRLDLNKVLTSLEPSFNMEQREMGVRQNICLSVQFIKNNT